MSGRRAQPVVVEQAGMTLVELIVSMVIMEIIFATLATVMVVGLRQGSTAETELIEQQGAALTARYFVTDVQGAMRFDQQGDVCGAGGVLTLGTTLTSGVERGVTYRVEETTAGGPWAVVRRVCDGGAQVSEIVLAERLAEPATAGDANDPDGPPVTVTCPGSTGSSCRIDVIQTGNPSSQPPIDPFNFTLDAVPRGSQ